eukprot:755054-Rhodomonas_salina.4
MSGTDIPYGRRCPGLTYRGVSGYARPTRSPAAVSDMCAASKGGGDWPAGGGVGGVTSPPIVLRASYAESGTDPWVVFVPAAGWEGYEASQVRGAGRAGGSRGGRVLGSYGPALVGSYASVIGSYAPMALCLCYGPMSLLGGVRHCPCGVRS